MRSKPDAPMPEDLPGKVRWLRRRLSAARRRLNYWKTTSPSGSRLSKGEGLELAKADVERLSVLLAECLAVEEKFEIRAYTEKGRKVFLPFDLDKFCRVIRHAQIHRQFGNATLEKALSAATDNKDDRGKKHGYLRLEWLCRDPETGSTSI